jgi:2'-5' RNA ligase superfamily
VAGRTKPDDARRAALHAVELSFDPAAEARVRAIWEALARDGVPTTALFDNPHYRPHVSLAVFEAPDPGPQLPVLRAAVAGAVGVDLRLTNLGMFVDGERLIAFLGVAASGPLLRAHQAVASTLDGAAPVNGFYRPGAWTPHCSLPVCPSTAAEVAATVAVARAAQLPVRASVAGAHLIELATGAPVAALG